MKTIHSLLIVLALASCSEREDTASANNDASSSASPAAPVPYPLETCLVSGEELGSMGDPVVLVHEGREIKFCCDRCEPKFREDPEKYLSQLDNP